MLCKTENIEHFFVLSLDGLATYSGYGVLPAGYYRHMPNDNVCNLNLTTLNINLQGSKRLEI